MHFCNGANRVTTCSGGVTKASNFLARHVDRIGPDDPKMQIASGEHTGRLRMPETQEFTYRHGDTTLTGQIARPVGDGPHPAVLVMHSALGLEEHMCRRAGDLADLGYQIHAINMNVIKPTDKRRDEMCASLGCKQRLVR